MEFSVRGELMHVSEQIGPGGQTSYRFSWLNGPAHGSYGFTISLGAGQDPVPAGGMPPITREQLASEAHGFITAFYAPGGIGEQDFPDHVPPQGPRNKEMNKGES